MTDSGDNSALARFARLGLHDQPRIDRSDTIAAGVAFVISLVVYLMTLAPTVTGEDSGELIAAAWLTGVPHPPGYPLWCILTKPFFLVPIGDMAWRANLASAFYGAAAVSVVFLIARLWACSRAAAFAGALALAFSLRFWSQSVITEVYALNAFLFAGLWLLMELWRAAVAAGPEARGRARKLTLAIGLAFGLALSNHYMLIALTAPGAALMVVPHRRWLKDNWQYVLGALGACCLGLSAYLYLPYAASHDTFINWGDPDTWDRFRDHVLRRSYRSLEFSHEVTAGTKLRFIGHMLYELSWQFTPVALPLMVVGLVALWRADRWRLASSAGVFLLNTLVLILILRFTYERENRQRFEPYYLLAWTVCALWLALGTSRALALLVRRLETRRSRLLWVPVAAMAVVPALPLVVNYGDNDRSGFWIARDYSESILKTAGRDAVLFPSADFTTFPLIYLMGVEGQRPDVLLADKTGVLEPEVHELFKGLAPEAARATDDDIIRTIASRSSRPVYVSNRSVLASDPAYSLVPEGLLYRVAPRNRRVTRRDVWGEISVRGVDASAVSSDAMERSLAASYHRMRAEWLLSGGDKERGTEFLRKAAAASPDEHKAMNNLGSLAAEYGLADLASKYFARAIALWPRYKTPRSNLASLALDGSRIDQAERWIEELAKMDPKDRRLPGLRSRLNVVRLRAAVAASPNDPVLHNDLGTALAMSGRAKEGAAHWLKAIELRPLYALPHKNLAVYYARDGKDSKKAAYHRRQYERISRLTEAPTPGLPGPPHAGPRPTVPPSPRPHLPQPNVPRPPTAPSAPRPPMPGGSHGR